MRKKKKEKKKGKKNKRKMKLSEGKRVRKEKCVKEKRSYSEQRKRREDKKKNQEVNDEKEGETKRKESFYTKDSELKSAFYSNKPMFVLLYKEMLLNINDLDSSLPSAVSSLLQEFKYVILEDDPSGLPLEETQELQSQVEELISPCVIHLLLQPKKDGLWMMCIYFHAINNIMVKIRGRIFLRKGGE